MYCLKLRDANRSGRVWAVRGESRKSRVGLVQGRQGLQNLAQFFDLPPVFAPVPALLRGDGGLIVLVGLGDQCRAVARQRGGGARRVVVVVVVPPGVVVVVVPPGTVVVVVDPVSMGSPKIFVRASPRVGSMATLSP